MKFSLFISLLLLVLACGSQVSKGSKFDQGPINKVLNQQVEHWNNGSIDGFMEGYWHSDSLRFIGKRGIRTGYDSVAASYKRHYPTSEKMGILSFNELQYTSLDNVHSVVNVTGRWNIRGVDSAGGFFSLIFKDIEGQWKIVVDHTW